MSHDSHDHNHSIVITAQDLTSGSVLITSEPNSDNPPTIATKRGVLSAYSHDNDTTEKPVISPIEYVLSGLALSSAQTLKMAIKQNNMDIKKFFIAISQIRENSQTNITREIIIDGNISDGDKETLRAATKNCPVQKVLNNFSVKTVIV